jgi:uncharacterized protein YndB with AHSA1/START domain
MAAVTSRSAVLTLPTDTQILVKREFAAPRHLVFKAFTTPEFIERWWTAKRGSMTVCEVDLRVGGKWRYVMIAGGGQEVAFHGEYREIVPNERVVSTETFEGAFPADHEFAAEDYTLNTATFEESEGRTTLTLLTEAQSKEVRDIIVATGMEDGLQDALDLLEEVSVSLA